MNKQPTRRRLSREDRLRQLLDIAWQLIGDEGTDALTLGRLAERAGITKPVVYDHFGTRTGLLIALYQDFDERQSARLDFDLRNAEKTLVARAATIAACYVDCVTQQGREIPGIIAALAGSPELEQVKRRYHRAFLMKCRDILVPFVESGNLDLVSLWAVIGAAEALSYAAQVEEITVQQAKIELFNVIISTIARYNQNS